MSRSRRRGVIATRLAGKADERRVPQSEHDLLDPEAFMAAMREARRD